MRGIVNWEFVINIRVTIPGDRSISGYCYPKVNFCKKNQNCLILNINKCFKTKYLYNNQLWSICQAWALTLFFPGSLSAHFLSMDHYRSIAYFADFQVRSSLNRSKKTSSLLLEKSAKTLDRS